MNIFLDKLLIENFRKQRNFDLEVNGANATVFADNGVGKSTLRDAWEWLLVGKVADGRGDAEIKTLAEDGPVHNLIHGVTASLRADGVPLKLRRAMKERWTKKRGSLTPEFTGHTYEYEVDDVPVDKAQFEAKVASLCPPHLLPALTNPAYFPGRLPWEERRAVLLSLAGDFTQQDVFASAPELAPLAKAIGAKSVEDFEAMCAAQRKKINTELLTIPARIDECSRMTHDEDVAELQEAIRAAQGAVESALQAEGVVKAGGGVAELKIEIRGVEAEIRRHGQTAMDRMADATRSARSAKGDADQAVQEAEATLVRRQREAERLRESVTQMRAQVENKRRQWELTSEEEFVPPAAEDKVCPTCGHKLTIKAAKEAAEKAQEAFNLAKAQRLQAIQEEGAALKGRLIIYETELESISVGLQQAVAALDDAHAGAAHATQVLADANAAAAPVDDGTLAALQAKLADLESRAQDAGEANGAALEAARTATQRAQLELNELLERKAKVVAAEDAQTRKKELEQKQRDLSREHERLTGLIDLCGRYVVARCDALSDLVNGMFRSVRWQLFERQINGGINECCIATYRGTPYLECSTSEKIKMGLDIICGLSAKLGITVPVWVDNAESCTALIPMDGHQVVSLVVSSKDRKLRVELNREKQAVTA